MKAESYRVIGIMSGTSLDGLDIAYCKFKKKNKGWQYTVEAATTFNYPDQQKIHLNELMNATGIGLTEADFNFGYFIGDKVNSFVKKYGIKKVDFIASHGHTIFHQPKKGFTLQIGHGAAIHAKTNLPVICDFRSVDVANGGQGAPLVPIGDKLLYTPYTFCLNLGGISNISFDHHKNRIAYDISPVNIVLNELSKQGGQAFDKGGKMGKKGKVNEQLLQSLNNLNYYQQKFPKSIGREWVDEQVFPLIKESQLSLEDKMATFYEHTCTQIANEVLKNAGKMKSGKLSLLCTGGGALNDLIIELLSKKLDPKVKVVVPDKDTILFKEAIIFAFLGVLRARNEVNSLKSVTGAKKDNVGGAVYGSIVMK